MVFLNLYFFEHLVINASINNFTEPRLDVVIILLSSYTLGFILIHFQELESALKIEQEAYEDCLADLEATQKKLKTVKLQLNALRAEQEGVSI